jgi:hypothetical protein
MKTIVTTIRMLAFCLSPFAGKLNAQQKTITSTTPKTHWYQGKGIYVLGAYQLGAINMQRNPFSQTFFSGWSAAVLIKTENNPHFLIEYGTTLKTNLSADWINIKEQHVNVNAWFEAFSKEKSAFITMLGLGFKKLDGYYTGILKEREYEELYKSNSKVSNAWLGLNAGLGYEVNVDPVSIFLLAEVPVVWSDVGFGINDFIFKIGIKQKIPFKQLFSKNKDRYHWF